MATPAVSKSASTGCEEMKKTLGNMSNTARTSVMRPPTYPKAKAPAATGNR
jgi:hypothetical protein